MKKLFLVLALYSLCQQQIFSAQSPSHPHSAPKHSPVVSQPAAKHSSSLSQFAVKQQTMTSIYTAPGVATLQGGQWVGSEHLFNLSPDLGIYVEVVKPAEVNVEINTASIKDRIAAILRNSGFQPRLSLFADRSPLPFFHILIMLNPIEKGFVAYCTGRLFEEVQLMRTHLKVGITWQAITWEKQELIIFPTEQLQEQIDKTMQVITTAFGDRYKSYQNMPKND